MEQPATETRSVHDAKTIYHYSEQEAEHVKPIAVCSVKVA
jgi:hypothetical protein